MSQTQGVAADAGNPNVPVQAEAETSVSVGDAVSFDDLDVSEAVATRKAPKDAAAEPKEKEVAKAKEKEPAEADTDVDPKLGPQPGAAEVKMLKAKNGDADMQVPSDLTFMHKVDGKPEKVTVQELLNNYSGKVAYDKKFSEFSTQKKDFDTRVSTLNNSITEMFELSKSDPTALIDRMCQMAGIDPAKFQQDFLKDLADLSEKYATMSDIERSDYEKGLKLERYEREGKRNAERQAAEQSQKELSAKEQSVREKFSLSPEQFNAARIAMKESGIADDPTPTQVAQYNCLTTVEGLIKEISPDHIENDALLRDLTKVSYENPTFSREDLAEILRETLGTKNKEAKTLSRKLAKSQPNPKQHAKPSKSDSREVSSWDDL